MNKIFRVIWNRTLNMFVVASELAHGRVKASSTGKKASELNSSSNVGRFALQSLLTAGLAAAALLPTVASAAYIILNNANNAISDQNSFNFANGSNNNQHREHIVYLGTKDQERKVFAGSVVIGFGAGQAAQNATYEFHKEIVAIGRNATTTGGNSVVVGANSRARGGQAVAVGSTVIANAGQTVAIGNDVIAGQNGAIAIGGDDLGDKAAIVTNGGEVVGRYTCSSTGGNDGCATLTADYFVSHEDVTAKIRDGQISVTHPDIFLDVSGTGQPVYRLKKAFLNNRENDRNNTYVYSRLLPPEILAKYREHKASGKSLSQVTGNYSVLRSGSKYGDAYAPTWAEGIGSIVLGPKSVALGDGSVAIGTMSYAMGDFSTVLGSGAYALGRNSQAIGNNAYVAKDNSVGVGTGVQTLDNEGMAYGYRAISAGQGSLAIGSEVYADAIMDTRGYLENNAGKTFFVHRQSLTDGDTGDELGLLGYAMDSASNVASSNAGFNKGEYYSKAGPNNGVGRYIDTLEKIIASSVALTPETIRDNNTGVLKIKSSPDLRNSIVIGSRSASMGKNNIVLGRGAFARSANSMALGSYSYTLNENAMAVGLASRAFGKNSIAIGVGTSVETKATNSTVVGNASFAADESASIFGASSASYAKNTAIFGNNSTISQGADNSIIIGHDAFVSVPSSNSPQHQSGVDSKNMLAIGNEAHANLANSTALGYASKTDYRASDLLEKAWAPRGGISFRSESKVGVISVGSQGYERRIVNVAGGYRDTDAVNVSQLRALEDRIDAGTLEEDKVNLHFFSVNQKDGPNSNYTARRLATLERREQAYALYVRSRAQQLIMEARKKSGVDVDAEYESALNARVSKLRNELGNGVLSGNALENNNIINTYNGSPQNAANYNADAAFAAVENARKADEERLKPGNARSILNNDERAALKTRNFDNQGAKSENAIAIGYNASVEQRAAGAIALGPNATIHQSGNNRSNEGSIAIGQNSEIQNNAYQSVAIGQNSEIQNNAYQSVAIGQNSEIQNNAYQSVAIGQNSEIQNNAYQSVAIGQNSEIQNNAYRSVAIGNTAKVYAGSSSATVIGDQAEAKGYDSVAIGRLANTYSHFGVAVGNLTKIENGEQTIAIGNKAQAVAPTGTTVERSVLVGSNARMHGNYSVALGDSARVGTDTRRVTGSVAVGENARVEAFRGTALGNNTWASAANNNDGSSSHAPVAVGYAASARGEGALAVGARAVVGTGSNGEVSNATALGNNANASHTNSVALGANSNTAGENATKNANINGMALGDFAGHDQDPTNKNRRVNGVVSVGRSGNNGFTRQITNVAAGRIDADSTDAINGSQLFRVVERMPRYFSVNSNGVTNPTAEQSNASNDRALAQGSIAIGPYANIGNNANNAIAIGREAKSNGSQASDAVALGMQAWAGGRNTIAIGKRSFSNSQDAMAIGTEANAYSNAVVVGASAVASGTNNNAQNSVAVGQGAQVFGDHSVAVGASSTIGGANKINKTNVNWSFEGVTHVTGGSALGENSLVLANRGTALGNNAKVHSGEGAVALGYLTQVRGKGALAIGYSANARNGDSDANGAIALGYTTVASKINSLALGKGADANQEHSVALGSDAKTAAAQSAESASIGSAQNTADDEVVTFSGFQGTGANVLGTVSIGRVEGNTNQYRQIINVAAGRVDANSTDAINGSQLYQVANTPITFAGDSGSVQRRLGHTLTIKGKANSGLSVTANAQTKTLEIGFDANATGNLVQGDGVSLTGTLNNRLIGAGNVTVALDANTKAKLAQVKTYEVAIAAGSQDALTLDSATGTTATNQKYTLGFNANKLADAIKPHLGQLGATTKLSVGTTTHTIGEKNGALALSGSDDITLSLTSTGTADSPAASISFAITKDGAVANGDNKLVTGATVHGALEAAKTTILNQVNANANLGIRGNTTANETNAKVNLGTQQLTVKGDGTLVKTKAENQAITITIDDTQLTAKAKDAAKGAVKVINGTNTTVTEGTEGDFKTYAVNVSDAAIQTAAAGANLKYKAGSEATAKDTALSTGLHFQSGNDNITVATEANGVVKYSLAAALNNIASIGGGANDAKLSFGAAAVTVNNKKITGLADAALSDQSTDAVTGKQLKAIDDRVTANTNNIAGNTNKITSLEAKVGEGKLSFKGDTVEAKKIALATGTFNVKGKNGISTKTVDDGIEVSVDTTSIGSNVNLNYKANSDAAKSVSLATGLAFTNGTNTTAEVGDNGVVKFNLNDTLTGISSIANGTGPNAAKLSLTDGNGTDAPVINVNGAKLTGGASGAINATSTDFVTGKDVHAAVNEVSNALSNATLRFNNTETNPATNAKSVNLTTDVFTITGDNNVTVALKDKGVALSLNTSALAGDVKLKYKGANIGATDPAKEVALSTGLNFENTTNITTEVGDNGSVKHKLNAELKGITKITKNENGTGPSITLGDDKIEFNNAETVNFGDAKINANIAYTANGATAGKTVTLANGFNFTNGTHTVATVGENGVVTFDLKDDLKTAINNAKDSGITFGANGQGSADQLVKLTKKFSIEGNSDLTAVVAADGTTGNAKVTLTVNKGGQIVDNNTGLVTGGTVKAALDPINASITNINSKVGDGTLKFKGDTVDAKTIALATGTLNVKGKNGISTKTLDDGIEISVDTTNIGSNVNLSYKAAKEGTAKTTTLATGLHFKSGNDNITVATEANGVVKYSLAAALNNITSISNAGTTLALSATGLDVGNKKITSLANGTVGATSTDAVNGSQLHTALESIKNAIGGNASNADGSVGAPTFTLNGVDKANPPAGGATTPTTVNNVGDAISKLDEAIGNLKGGLTDAEIAYYSRNPAGAPATGKTTSNKQSTKLSDGLIFEGDHNVRTTAEADGVTKFALNKKLSGITSIEGDAGTAKITFGQDALEVNSKKITGLQDADISDTSTDAVTGKQLNATNTRVTTVEGKVTTLETKVGSGEFNYVGDTGGDQKIALTGKFNVNGKNGISTKSTAAGIEISVDTSSIGENVELSYKADGDQAAKKVKLSDGLVFTKTDNITTATAADGVVTHTLNANLKGVESLKNGDNGPTLKLGDGTANNKTFVVEGAELVDFGDAKINANIAYTANSTAAKKNVKLSDGFDFTNGTNTTAEVGDNGVVKFNLNNSLTGINSIANGTGGAGASITLGATDKNITVNGGKITGLADGTLGKTSTDAITGKQLHATNERVDTLETKVGEGKFTFQGDTVAAKKIALADGVFHVKGKNGISTKTVDDGIEITVDTTTIGDNIKIKYKASDVGGQAIGTQLEANLSTGFDFASTDNITTAVAANGKVTHTLNAALKDITSIAGKPTAGQESTKLTLGAGAVTLSSLGANGAAGTTDPKLTGLGSGSIAANSKDAITGHQLNSLATALGLTPANNAFTAPTFVAINKGHIAAGATGLASGTIKTAVDNLISTVNDGIQFGATAVKAGHTNPNRQNLGTTLKVVEGDLTSTGNTHFKGNNLKTEYAYDNGVGTISIGLTETPEFKAVELKGTDGVNGTTTTIDASGVKVKDTANPAKTLAELGKDKLEIVTGTNANNGDNKLVIGKDGNGANAKGVISGLTERKVGDLADLANDSYGKNGNAGRAATEGAVRDLAEKLNEKSDAGLDFIGSNSTATVVKRKLGEKLTVTGEGTVPAVDATAADNIRVDVDNANNALVVKLAKALKNIESVASATLPADTDGDSFKLANGEGLTFNKLEGSADPATTVSKTSTSSVDGLTAKKTTADSIDNVGVSTAGFTVSHREGNDETAGQVNQAGLATDKLSFSEAGGQNDRSAEYGLDTAKITDKDSNAFTATATSVTLQDNNAENKAVLSKTGVVTSNANQTSTLGADSLVLSNTAATGATPADQTSATLNRTSLAFTAADGSSAIVLNATNKTAKIGDVTIQGGTEKLVNVADIIKLDGANRKITLDVAGGKTLEIAKDVDGSGKITGLTVRNAKDNADDYGLGDNAGRAATESALKSLSDQLRGAASPFEYVDKDGKVLEKGQDGKFYVAEDLKDAKWDPATNSYKKADDTPLAAADTEGAGIRARPEEHLPKRLALGNIDSGIGLGNYGTDATEDGTPLTKFDANVKDATAKNGIVAARTAADKLYALDGDKLGNVATVGDLQAIAVAGLTFKGNHATNEVHRKLSDTLVIKGEGSLADTATTASDNIRVDVSNNDLIVKLAKAIKNLDSIESDPLEESDDGKYFKLGKEDGLTLRDKDAQGSKKVTVGLDGTEIRRVGADGKTATATYGIDGTELTDKDGKQATVKASEIKLADKAQDPTKTTTLTDAGLVVNEGDDTTTVNKDGVTAANGNNSTALNKDGVTAQDGTNKASLGADKLTLANQDPAATDKSTAELDRNSLTFKGNDGATEAIKLDADAQTAKIGDVTISGAKGQDGSNAASITGLANRTAGNTEDKVTTPGQAPTDGYGIGNNAGRAATEGAVRELADKLDLQSDSSPFEYVDANGAPVVKGKDGKFYAPAELKDATWIVDTSLPGGGKYVKGNDTVASVDDNSVTIKAKGETARTVGNVASGIGLTNYAATAPAQGAPAGTAPTLNVDTAKAAATSLYALSGNSLNNAATVGDLQALAIAGLTFKGNAADPSVHRKLGETLVIKGEVDTAANPNALAQDAATAAGNIRVDVSDNDLIIKLAKAIKNLESLESDPVADDAEGKAFKLGKEDGLTLTDKAADGKVTKSDTTANGTTITGPAGADGKNATASYGLDGSSIVGADGNSNTSNAQGTTIAGADGKNAALTADALTFSTKEDDDKATATLGKDGLTFTGKDGTETIKIDGNTGKISGITSSVVEVPDTNTDGKAGLADLEKSDAAAVATVGDLGKLGFVVSTSDKDGAETYEKAVRHGHRLNLTGSTDGLVTVTGSETAAGSHELKVDVKRGVIVPQGERFAVDKEGKPLVKVGEGDTAKYYRPEDIGANGQPNDGATAVEADKVATTADGEGFVTGNQVGAALSKSGFIVGKGDAESMLNRPTNRDERINPEDEIRFADGKNSVVTMTTKEDVDATGNKKTVTTVRVDVAGLPVGFSVPINGKDTPITKVGDKFYPVGEDGNPVFTKPDGTSAAIPETFLANASMSMTNPLASGNELGDPTRLGNVKAATTALPKDPNFRTETIGGTVYDARDVEITYSVARPDEVLVEVDGKHYRPDDLEFKMGKVTPKAGRNPVTDTVVVNGLTYASDNATAEGMKKLPGAEALVKIGDDYYRTSDVVTADDGTKAPKAGAMAANQLHGVDADAFAGLADLPGANNGDVITVADAKRLGFVVGTRNTDPQAKAAAYADKVQNANKLEIVGGHNIEVVGVTKGNTREVTVRMVENPEFNSIQLATKDDDGKRVEGAKLGTNTNGDLVLSKTARDENGNVVLDPKGQPVLAPVTITGVAPGRIEAGSTDAVTGGQVHELAEGFSKQLQGSTRQLSAGIAGAYAMAGLIPSTLPGERIVSVAGGHYKGQNAVAIGISATSDNGRFTLRASGSRNSTGEFGASIGAGYRW